MLDVKIIYLNNAVSKFIIILCSVKNILIYVDSKYNINNPLFSTEEIKNFLCSCYKKI